MPAKLNTETTKSSENTENQEKRFPARADIELSRFPPCPFVSLCELCVEFRDREYSEKLSKTAAFECKHLSRNRSKRPSSVSRSIHLIRASPLRFVPRHRMRGPAKLC